MDKDIKAMLDKAFADSLHNNSERIRQEEIKKLNKPAARFGMSKEDYDKKIDENVATRMRQEKVRENLEKEYYAEFGGSKQTADELFKPQKEIKQDGFKDALDVRNSIDVRTEKTASQSDHNTDSRLETIEEVTTELDSRIQLDSRTSITSGDNLSKEERKAAYKEKYKERFNMSSTYSPSRSIKR